MLRFDVWAARQTCLQGSGEEVLMIKMTKNDFQSSRPTAQRQRLLLTAPTAQRIEPASAAAARPNRAGAEVDARSTMQYHSQSCIAVV